MSSSDSWGAGPLLQPTRCRPSVCVLCDQGEGFSANGWVTLNLDYEPPVCTTISPCFSDPQSGSPSLCPACGLYISGQEAANMSVWVEHGVLSTCVCGAPGTRTALDLPQLPRLALSQHTAPGLLSAILATGCERAAPVLRGVWGGFNVPGSSHCPSASQHNSLLNYDHKFLQRDGSPGLWGVDVSVAEGSSHFC